MAEKIFRSFVIVFLLSVLVSAHEKIMVCKNIENVFANAENNRTGGQLGRIQGPPGKKGVPGAQGLPGSPGIQGPPGTPAFVDYDRISEIIENKIRQELEEINVKVEALHNNVLVLTELSTQLCMEESGIYHDGKCYTVPYSSRSNDISYNQAVEKCRNVGAVLGEVRSRTQQQVIQNFFRSKVPGGTNLWTGMIYLSSKGTVRFRSGKELPYNQFKWHSSYPTGSNKLVPILIMDNFEHFGEGFWNTSEERNPYLNGVICEKRL